MILRLKHDEINFKGVDLSKYDNSWYRPGPAWKRILWYWINAVVFNSSFFPFYKLKVFLLKIFGAKTGKNIFIKPYVNIKYPWLLEIGNNVWIGERVWIDNLAKITIGNNVCLSQGCLLLTGNHDYTKSSFDLIVKNIILQDGVWIGGQATVCGGVICKTHSVLSVGSVATADLESMTIYQGNPAIKVKQRKVD
ncbi:MAG TPA: WcaF family extracellular polysaccharide biosynthesis acetyltransferase [Chitinophagaceae bacterium]|nr:WcaF family extracellular polysaccharide biosynthesis acetyltransferase [Chitinophagaceae bacterium]